VDDDQSVRESLPDLLRSFGYDARAFASAEEFLASDALDTTGCLVLDVAMPGMSGPELFTTLRTQGRGVPVIFITAHGNGRGCTDLLAQGAAGCLIKPFDPNELINTIGAALKH
jgi:FixJ family two-component response regulator